MAPPEEFEVDSIPVTLTRKRVKNLNLRVRDADGSVAVSAPPHASREVVAAFVRDRRAWIERTRRALADEFGIARNTAYDIALGS